ncbi:MAG TPA: 4a-hydroxytetrahydrobiopterin dehydratase [Terriglobia bacterium]|nr:4a-hydroxytetrahydrobiopterin dehydratase [Terriglobia bacterium]
MAALSKNEIQLKLKDMRGWTHQGKIIQKRYTLKSFMPAIGLVNEIAEVAERAGHHPDITINYNVVGIALSTHSEGGVTQKDFELAQQIDKLAATHS